MAAYTNAELTKSENARFEESFTDIKRRNAASSFNHQSEPWFDAVCQHLAALHPAVNNDRLDQNSGALAERTPDPIGKILALSRPL